MKNDSRVMRTARKAIEHQPVATWADKALNEKDPVIQAECRCWHWLE